MRAAAAILVVALTACGSAGVDPFASYERPLHADGDQTETVAPATLRIAVSGDPAALDAFQAHLEGLFAEEVVLGKLSVVPSERARAMIDYARSGPFAAREPTRVRRCEVSFTGRIRSALSPMRAVWIDPAGKKTGFDLSKRGSPVKLVDEGLDSYRLVFDLSRKPLLAAGRLVALGDGAYAFAEALPVKLYERRKKRWARIKMRVRSQRVQVAPPARVRVFEVADFAGRLNDLFGALVAENWPKPEGKALSVSLERAHLWMSAELRSRPSEPEE